ncbi:endonuclease/exonuclease/phosphatase family protein [Nesterenkonia natronophila]|uniref:Endonuclease/exonuclease/phosphatase family protein n=2 Tax=Nesterenkonia natronophila TaxID=2174932 RepID=A0A3A4F3G9_9MICC|nr:endonuclease/exonuclease/phosphatase family protein [Nesterenkonia natronophila]
MSWNIRRRSRFPALRSADRWSERAPRLQGLLTTERPTVLGVQEALADQAFFAQASLGDGYRVTGRGRSAAGRGEGTPIIYDAERLEMLDWEQTALSRRPNTPGSRSWGSIYPRIMVTASFRDRATGLCFLIINTHLDHLSERARLMAARMLRKTVTDSSLPAIVTGDLNAGADSAAMRELQHRGMLEETWTVAGRHRSRQWDTFANYAPPQASSRRVDWILASPSFQVASAAVNAERYAGGWASDHLPVQAVMRLAEAWPGLRGP